MFDSWIKITLFQVSSSSERGRKSAETSSRSLIMMLAKEIPLLDPPTYAQALKNSTVDPRSREIIDNQINAAWR